MAPPERTTAKAAQLTAFGVLDSLYPLLPNEVGGTLQPAWRNQEPTVCRCRYLGAGKTTLVNYILTAKHGCR